MFTLQGETYYSAKDIAQEMGVTYRAVLTAIRELGDAVKLVNNLSDLRNEGYNVADSEKIEQHIINRAYGA